MSRLPTPLGTELDVLPPDVRADAEAAMGYIRCSRAANTRAAYGSDWKQFTAYCEAHGFTPLPAPPGVVVAWLAWMSRPTDDRDPVQPGRQALSPNTISRRLAAVNARHRDHGLYAPGDTPEVRQVLEGLKRYRGTAPESKAPLLAEDVRRMAALCDRSTAAGRRDRALILLGFNGAFRRSEISNLDADAIHAPRDAQGIIVRLEQSKSDQQGKGREVSVLEQDAGLCPVQALREWLEVAGIGQPESISETAEAPVFRSVQRDGQIPSTIRHRRRRTDPVEERPNRLSPKSIGRIISRYAEAIGHDPSAIGAHSLRAGYVTSALLSGAPMHRIQEITGHNNIETLMRYYRYSGSWEEHPSSNL